MTQKIGSLLVSLSMQWPYPTGPHKPSHYSFPCHSSWELNSGCSTQCWLPAAKSFGAWPVNLAPSLENWESTLFWCMRYIPRSASLSSSIKKVAILSGGGLLVKIISIMKGHFLRMEVNWRVNRKSQMLQMCCWPWVL